MDTIRSTRVRLAIAPLLLILVAGALASCQSTDSQATYVALGDSYTSGPLVLPQTGLPVGCLRSGRNYPALVAQQLKVTHFSDVSCSGATTADMFAAQSVTPGPANAPQLNALNASVTLVTLGIGGNDIGFSDIIKNCAVSFPWSAPCKNKYVVNGDDTLSDRIAATQAKVAQVLAAIHQRAPQAKVLVVGYPTILPETGNGCYPYVPLLGTDVVYLRAKVKELNAMLATTSSGNSATYVDTATSSIGHDFCQLVGNWVEGLVPTTDAAPVHPNAAGLANTAKVVAARAA